LQQNHPTVPSGALARFLERSATSPLTWGVFLLFGVAALVRQYLFAHSYWYDESYLILTIREHGFAQLLGPQPYNLAIPPGFLWLTRALYELGGDGELMLRLPAFVAGVVALFLMIPLPRLILGRAHAFYAFAWFAASRHLLVHACEVRPYTFDLLLGEMVLLCAAALLRRTAQQPAPAWALAGLGTIAVIGPWVSFPSAFVLGGASLALALQLGRSGSRREWLLWLTFNGLVGLSGLALWWFSGRHMYYPGMIEHWGHRGWWGFPDWHSPANLCRWLLWRPYEIGNYGTRELGIVLAGLAVVGACAWAKNARPLVVLLCGPFFLALAAALLGKYPLAHRTAFFLLPCLWLLAARGLGAVVEAGRRRGLELAALGLLLVAWDFAHTVAGVVRPDARIDYRGAYVFVRAHRQANDALWAQMAVVYETYYGKDAPILRDADWPLAQQVVGQQRLWAVMGNTRHDLRQRLEEAGGRVILSHQVSGLSILLFEPKAPPTRKVTAAAP
jgi:hypothetical protein